MRFILIVFIVIGSHYSLWSLSCINYKTGKFILFDQNTGIHTRIERTANLQTETDLKTGKYIKFNVKWLNDCEYELTFAEGNNDQVAYFRHRKLKFRITDVFADGYRFEANVQGASTIITNILRVF